MARSSDAELSLLLEALAEAFDKKSWHGPNLRGSLRGVTAVQAAWRPMGDRHNIWELALHCAYWKYAVRNRLISGKRSAFPLEGSNFFRRDERLTRAAWQRDFALLKEQHAALKATILALDPATLDKRLKRSKHTVRRTVLGIAAHDIYHAGQISLLKRMASQRPKS